MSQKPNNIDYWACVNSGAIGRQLNCVNASTQLKVKFCKTHKLNYHQFLYWCNKLGKKTPQLIPFEISAKDEVIANVRLKGGHILEITGRTRYPLSYYTQSIRVTNHKT